MSNSSSRPHDGYREFQCFQTAPLVYDETMIFCNHFNDECSGAHNQMTQTARSCVQNIVEGIMALVISKETGLKFAGITRASVVELLLYYADFLRQHDLQKCEKALLKVALKKGYAWKHRKEGRRNVCNRRI